MNILCLSGLIFSCLTIQGYNKLTILTKPIGVHHHDEGHPAVMRSLLVGLQQLGVPFNYNPVTMKEVGDVVYVVACMDALYQGISLRKKGRIKKLLAGPNLMNRAHEHNRILASPEIDAYIVNSFWTKHAYIEDEPSLKNRIYIWYAGVDTSFWQPVQLRNSTSNQVLIYWKTESEEFCKHVETILKQQGWNPMRIRYGSYTKQQYKELLERVAFVVVISRTESQGIALAESWSMNRPTLVWDPQEPFFVNDKWYWPISAAPYLNDQLGLFWKNTDELEYVLSRIKDRLHIFEPRDWVLKNMSDQVSAKLLLSIVDEVGAH